YLSKYSPSGMAGRFDRLGHALQESVKVKNPAGLQAARSCLAYISEHALAGAEQARLARAEMAFRLIRWLKTTNLPSSDSTFPELAEFYVRDGGFLDWARNRLREMDVSPPMQGAFRKILDQIDSHFVQFEEGFARKLAEWTKTEQQSERLR